MTPEIEAQLLLYIDALRVSRQEELEREADNPRQIYQLAYAQLISDADRRSASFLAMRLREIDERQPGR
jgi:hypothetical protein